MNFPGAEEEDEQEETRKHCSRMRTICCSERRGVYLPGGCTYQGVTCLGGVPAQGVNLPRVCTCPGWGCICPGDVPSQGGVPTWGVYLPGGSCPGGVPTQCGVYLPSGCTCPGWVYLLVGCTCPGGYTCPGGCTCLGDVPTRGVPAQGVYPACTEAGIPPCGQNDRQV